jgi:hypothetical protein
MDMKTSKGGWIARVILGAALGVLSSVVLASYLAESRGPTLAVSLLCAGLGGVLSAATLPFADDGRSLLLHSAVHFEATALLFGLLMAQLGARGAELLAWEAILFLLYAVVWLGRWIGWYVEVMQLRTMLGLAPGPSPLKWRETLPYLAFALLLCDVLPMLLFWADHAVSADVPVLSGLLLPYLLLPVAGFSSGMSLGKRQGVCPLYPAACFVCYLPMVFLLFNYTAMFHCFMVAVPALAGNVTGWLYRRAASKKKS